MLVLFLGTNALSLCTTVAQAGRFHTRDDVSDVFLEYNNDGSVFEARDDDILQVYEYAVAQL